MLARLENRNAKIRQVVPRDVDTALIPVEQTDLTCLGDPNIRCARIAMHDSNGHVGEFCEHRLDDHTFVDRHGIEVDIHAHSMVVQCGDDAAPRSLTVFTGERMESLQLRSDSRPICFRVRWAAFDPSLDDDIGIVEPVVVGRDNGRNHEPSTRQELDQPEFPSQR